MEANCPVTPYKAAVRVVAFIQRRGADVAGSANNFLMILLGSTPMA